jgi:tetratricopeptide (TPR) repeat protein
MAIRAAAFQARMLLTLLAGLAPGLAVAADEFACRIRNARQLLEYHRYPQALQELARAKPLVGDVPLRGLVIALHAGVAFAQLGDTEQALTAFRAALAADPHARLPVAASPRLLREFEEARLRVVREAGLPSDAPRVRAPEPLLSTWLREFPRTPPPPPPLDLSVRVLRPRFAVPATASVALALSGGVFWILARRETSRFINDDPQDDPKDADEVARVVSRARTYQVLEFGFLGASVAALGIAISQYVRREPDPRQGRTLGSPSAVPPFLPLESCS